MIQAAFLFRRPTLCCKHELKQSIFATVLLRWLYRSRASPGDITDMCHREARASTILISVEARVH
jgi:hypothetical protein